MTNVTGSLLRQQHWAAASSVQPMAADSAADAQELLAAADALDLLVTDTVCELLREYGPSSSSSAPDGSAAMPPSADANPTTPRRRVSVAQPSSAGRLRATLHLVTHLVYTVASIRYVATAVASFHAGRCYDGVLDAAVSVFLVVFGRATLEPDSNWRGTALQHLFSHSWPPTLLPALLRGEESLCRLPRTTPA